MADDLIIKYFRENLTESEEEALAERLRTSTEEALRFGQHAEASYRHYGLPEPQWTGAPPPPGFPGAGGLGMKLWLPLALAVGSMGWIGWHFAGTMGKERPLSPPSAAVSGPPAPSSKAQASAPGWEQEIPDEVREDAPSPQEDVEGRDLSDRPAVPASAGTKPALLAPVPASAHRTHSNLEVVVNRTKPGNLTVEVLDPEGRQAVLLYQGTLPPGSWAFDWDGNLGSGQKAAPGTYRIQVESGAVTQSKRVVIR
ncbi:MAG TPA: FlgD immunoglobulin-like domain containing protein [bacterium]|nr:FlgD immunoglobulin-like domain containing protein [bacterium]